MNSLLQREIDALSVKYGRHQLACMAAELRQSWHHYQNLLRPGASIYQLQSAAMFAREQSRTLFELGHHYFARPGHTENYCGQTCEQHKLEALRRWVRVSDHDIARNVRERSQIPARTDKPRDGLQRQPQGQSCTCAPRPSNEPHFFTEPNPLCPIHGDVRDTGVVR